MVIGTGSLTANLQAEDVRPYLAAFARTQHLTQKRLLIVIPDGTRTAPLPMLFRLFYEELAPSLDALDFLIALGTHPPMSEEAIARLIDLSAEERAQHYPKSRIFNHQWNDPTALSTLGTIPAGEVAEITGGLLAEDIPVTLNRKLHEYDVILLCGPVFPHEVAGFSGGAKYLFPGIAGPEIINATHWLGAISTSMHTIGVRDTPVRRVMHRAAEYVRQPLYCLALVMQKQILRGVYLGSHLEAFQEAAKLSAQLNIITIPQPVRQVLSCPAPQYDDLWTAAKAMYKTEPIIADGGEVIIYAPHIQEFSYSHGSQIEEIGFHVRDYFLKQWERFQHIPGSILAHSTHVKGAGSYDAQTGVETPRIQVTLATGISQERCERANLGYRDYRSINPEDWQHREGEGLLYVPHAGEMLYRLPEL